MAFKPENLAFLALEQNLSQNLFQVYKLLTSQSLVKF